MDSVCVHLLLSSGDISTKIVAASSFARMSDLFFLLIFTLLNYTDPSTPNYPEVNKTLLKLERETLGPYALPGNIISMNMYDELPLPWNISPAVSEFPKSKFVKHEYDRDGVLSNGKTFFAGNDKETLEDIEGGLGTASMVTRWRAANPELVGTDKDVVQVFLEELKAALGEQEWIERGSSTAILLFKKS